jgi:uncharacterized protein with GYD domain
MELAVTWRSYAPVLTDVGQYDLVAVIEAEDEGIRQRLRS